MKTIQKITPFLWFDDQAEEAAGFYTSIFRNSKITHISRYGEAGFEVHGKPAGSVLTVAFELDGQAFTALEWWSDVQIQRSHIIPNPVRDPGRSGPLLGKSLQGRR